MAFRTLDDADVASKKVLLRVDLNVPVRDGRITDLTRIERLSPTIRELSKRGAKVIILSHFDRPRGERVPHMSLAPMAAALGQVLGVRVRFVEDCVGIAAQQAVELLRDGDVLVMENTRFHAAEEQNEAAFAAQLAGLGELYVNDAFSAAHRAHASTHGIAAHLPAYAGRLMQQELEALDAALGNPARPVMAVVGGSKVSTKLDLLGNLCGKVETLVIGGAMANTFLAAQGVSVGASLQEASMHDTAREIMGQAQHAGCEIVLPVDAVTSAEFRAHARTHTVAIDAVAEGEMILDVGPRTLALLLGKLAQTRTLVWNGPLGAFETPPFDTGTMELARAVAEATDAGTLRSVAGGGDTVSALRQAGVTDRLSYVSTAGGAFLEWLEGKTLPGVAALHPG